MKCAKHHHLGAVGASFFIVGALLGLLAALYATSAQTGAGKASGIMIVPFGMLILGYIVASIYWGWLSLSKLTSKFFLILPIAGWFIYLYIKFCLSIFIGPFIMPVKVIALRKELRNLQEWQVETQ